jgi:NitT/TauT family transport system substrate-binding protein
MSRAGCPRARRPGHQSHSELDPGRGPSAFYYAKTQGWYEKAGIDLGIEAGKGSGVSSLKVGSGGVPFGIADLATMLVARSKGADTVALTSIYANTGQTAQEHRHQRPEAFRWLQDRQSARRCLAPDVPRFCQGRGRGAGGGYVRQGRPDRQDGGIESRTVDIISDFYNSHDVKKEFGSDLGSLNWKDIGLNAYGNSLILNGAFLEKNPKLAEHFVKITQKPTPPTPRAPPTSSLA